MSGSKNYGTFTRWNTTQQKERSLTFCDSMDGTGEYYAKWNKSGSERQIPYDLTYKGNQSTKQTSEQNRTRDMEIKDKLTVTRGEEGGDNRRKERKGQVKEHV